MEKIERVAICTAGEPRSLNYTHESIKKFFDTYFGEYDIFAYIPKCPTDFYMEKYFPNAHIEVREDTYIDDTKIPSNNMFKTGTQRYLQQINGWKESNRMRKEYEKSKGFEYDWVIRSRIDVEYVPSLPPGDYTQDFLYLPNFHHFGGVNDRFAMGSSKLMDKYLNIIDIYNENPKKCLHAECFLKYCLDYQKVPFKLIDIRFMRVRDDGQKMKHDLVDR